MAGLMIQRRTARLLMEDALDRNMKLLPTEERAEYIINSIRPMFDNEEDFWKEMYNQRMMGALSDETIIDMARKLEGGKLPK